MIWAVIAALCSAAAFAGGSALQHRAVTDASDQSGSDSFFRRVLHRPSWLVGLLLSAAAFTLHAVALGQGDLVVVQPVIVSGIVFAVLIRSGLERQLPKRSTLLWLVATWAGLALFLGVHPAEAAGRTRPALAVVLVIVTAVVALALRLATLRIRRDRVRGVLLGTAAGLMFGLVAGLMKLVVSDLGAGVGTVLGHWPVWALVMVGITAVVWNQRAYQATRLAVSAPVLNVAQVLLALAFGVAVFAERLGGSPGVIIGELLGLALMIAGIVRLATAD